MSQLYLFDEDFPYKRTKNPLVPSPKLAVSEVKLSYTSKVKPQDRPKVTCSKDAYDIFYNAWDPGELELFESVYVLYLNRANYGVGLYKASKGGTSGTVVQPGHVALTGFLLNASGGILAHNHPSSNRKPSEADIAITKSVKEAFKICSMELLDHIILPGHDTNYLSFADDDLMPR